jgi:hypothetical protein
MAHKLTRWIALFLNEFSVNRFASHPLTFSQLVALLILYAEPRSPFRTSEPKSRPNFHVPLRIQIRFLSITNQMVDEISDAQATQV